MLAINIFELYGTIGLKDAGFQAGINNAKESASGLASGIKNLVGTVAGIKVVSTAFDMVRNSIGGAVERYDTLNRFPLVLEQMGYSADAASAATQRLSDGVQGLPTTLDDIVANAQRLTILTGNLESATDTTLALNNAFLASGSSSADASRGLNQYVQMLSAGKVDMQSWRTLQETMGYALRETAAAFGFAGDAAVNDLYAALQTGVITFSDFNAKIIELNDGVGGFAELAKTSTVGIGTAWTNMQTAVVRGTTSIVASIDEGLSQTRFGSIQNIIEGFGRGFNSVMTSVAGVIKPVVANLDILAPAVIASVVAFKGYQAVTAFASATQAASKIIKSATLAQEQLTLSTIANTAVEDLARMMKDKSAATEAIRIAAKKAGLAVDSEGILVTAAGTVATEAEAAAVMASAGAFTTKTAILGLFTGGATAATAATWLLNAALNALPFVGIIAGVAGLVAGFSALDKIIKTETETAKRAREETEKLSSAAESLVSSIESSESAHKSNISSIEAEAAASRKLVDEIDNMSAAERASTDGKARLASYVDILNDSIEGLNLQIIDEAGNLNLSTAAINDNIEAFRARAEAQAIQERYSEVLKEQALIEEQLAVIEARRAQTTLDYEAHAINADQAIAIYKELEATEAALVAQNVELSYSYDYLSGRMVVTTREAAENLGDTFLTLNESQQSFIDTMVGTLTGLRDDVLNVFDTLTTESELTLTQMTSNLESNIAASEQYWSNIATLYENGWGDVAAAYSDGSEKSMQVLNEFINSSEEEQQRFAAAMKAGAEIGSEEWKNAMRAANIPEEVIGIMAEAAAAQEAVDWSGVGEGAGKDVGKGLVVGIDNSGNEVYAATSRLGEEAEKGIRTYLQSQSPSKLFMDIGKDTVIGLAQGVAQNTSAAVAAMRTVGENIVNGVINGINNKRSALINAAVNMATAAYKAAKDALIIESPSKLFRDEIGAMLPEGMALGIQDTTPTAIAAAEKMAKDAYAAAKLWIEDYRNATDYAISEELEMWQYLSTVYTDVSKEKVEVDKNISKLQEAIAQESFNHSKNWIDKRKTYNILTLQDEIDAWERVQARYAEGTAQREAADKALYDARNKLLAEQENILSKIQAVQERYATAVENRAKAIYNTYGLFDKLSRKAPVSGMLLTKNLQAQVAEMQNWSDNMAALAARGIDEGLLEELRAMGPSANAEITALTKMTDEELSEYAELWGQKQSLAKNAAVTELQGLRAETNAEIWALMQQMQDTVARSSDLIGENLVQGIIDGLESESESLVAAAESMTGYLISTTKTALGIASPSTVFAEIGGYIVDGMTVGMETKRGSFFGYVYSFFSGIVAQAKAALGIASPSKVMETLGGYTAEGYIIGLENMAGQVADTMDSMFVPDISRPMIGTTTAPVASVRSVESRDTTNMMAALTAEGFNNIVDAILAALPRIVRLAVNGSELAETTFADFENAAARRGRIFAPTHEQIAGISRTVVPAMG